MEKSSFHVFRLRENEQIVGYMRYIRPNAPYFSKDRFWWKAAPITFNQKDAYAEQQDINQQWIFDGDIVEFKPSDKSQDSITAAIVYDFSTIEFVAVDCKYFEPLKREQWHRYQLKVISYLFINEELTEELTDRGWLQ